MCTRQVLEPAHPLTQWVPERLSTEVSRPGREAEHLPPFSAEGENAWIYTSSTPLVLWGRGCTDN